MSSVLAFDPGGTTGWCLLETPVTPVEFGVLRGPGAEQVGMAIKLLDRYHPDTVAIESFRLRPAAARALSWSDMPEEQWIGAVERAARERNITVSMQDPACKRFFADKLIRACAPRTGSRHSDDALRHALYWSWFKADGLRSPEVRAIYERILAYKVEGRAARRSEKNEWRRKGRISLGEES